MGETFEKLLFVAEYNYALENEDVNELDQIIAELVKKYKNLEKCKIDNEDYKKELGKQCLKIFNLKNTKGYTAVMITAEQGRADILKKWYYAPDYFIKRDKSEEIYKQKNYSYTTQDKEGRNALMLACKSQNPDCIEYILSPETKEMLNQKDINNKTPIECAVDYNVRKNGYTIVDEFIRVFSCIIYKKSKYFPNESFHLDKRYLEVAYKMEDDDAEDVILNAYKKTNASKIKEVKQKGDRSKTGNNEILGYNDFNAVSDNKVAKKRSMGPNDELEESSNKRLKTNGTTTKKTSKLLETHNSTHTIKEGEYFIEASIKSKASTIKPAQIKKVIPQDIDTSKLLANNLQENSYKPGSGEYNKFILDKFKTFIGKINTSSTDCTTQTALLDEFKESFFLLNYSFPEEGIQFISLVNDNNMCIKMIDMILGSSDEFN